VGWAGGGVAFTPRLGTSDYVHICWDIYDNMVFTLKKDTNYGPQLYLPVSSQEGQCTYRRYQLSLAMCVAMSTLYMIKACICEALFKGTVS
jgi:hypothetical protein